MELARWRVAFSPYDAYVRNGESAVAAQMLFCLHFIVLLSGVFKAASIHRQHPFTDRTEDSYLQRVGGGSFTSRLKTVLLKMDIRFKM